MRGASRFCSDHGRRYLIGLNGRYMWIQNLDPNFGHTVPPLTSSFLSSFSLILDRT